MQKEIEVETIVIDWYGTLSNSKYWSGFERSDGKLYDAINNFLFNQHKQAVRDWMRGQKSYQQICKEISDALNQNYDLIVHGLLESAQNMQFDSQDIPALIQKIRGKGIRVILATDNMDVFADYTVPTLKLRENFDDILISTQKKVLKNDMVEGKLTFFNLFVENIRKGDKKIILIDDDPGENILKSDMFDKVIQQDTTEGLVRILKEYAL